MYFIQIGEAHLHLKIKIVYRNCPAQSRAEITCMETSSMLTQVTNTVFVYICQLDGGLHFNFIVELISIYLIFEEFSIAIAQRSSLSPY